VSQTVDGELLTKKRNPTEPVKRKNSKRTVLIIEESVSVDDVKKREKKRSYKLNK